ncbi:MAG: 3-deoxy-manno-octulosonate cytidylyltransferase [Deltaproteobacteria bacterium]|nr:3-deoxy-manno-octulosonate cytidylyltransferase [Deltaproteobacteria bacterium]
MRIVAIIPSRYGSSRFPGKPLASIAGRPMIEHVYRRVSLCEEISDVFTATDDQRILACVEGFGGKAVMTRKTHASGTDRLAESAGLLDLEDGDLVVNVQGDQPLVDPAVLAEMVEPLVHDESLSMSTLMVRIHDPGELSNPNHVKVVCDARGFALYFSRLPIPFHRDAATDGVHYKHLGLYAYRTAFLRAFTGLPEGRLERAEKLEQLRALEHGHRIRVVETVHDSPEVDTPEDLARIESMMARTQPP